MLQSLESLGHILIDPRHKLLFANKYIIQPWAKFPIQYQLISRIYTLQTAADHVIMLYKVTSKLQRINYMYDFSLEWFIRVVFS